MNPYDVITLPFQSLVRHASEMNPAPYLYW